MRKITFIVALTILLMAFTFSNSALAQKPVELTYSTMFPAVHKHVALNIEWGKEIEKRTNGRVKVTVFPGSTLTPPDKCYDGVVRGISDVGMSVLAYTRGRFPLTEVIDLPLGYKNAIVPTKMINEYYKKFRPKEFDDSKVMYLHAHGPGILHTKEAVNKLEDLKGMKIRCTGLAAKIVSVLGGTPVAMPMSETYDSLNRGVVEGSMAPYEALAGWKWGEVIKFTVEEISCAYTSGWVVNMNMDKWNALPSDIQKIIEKINEEWIEKTGIGWDELDKWGKDFTLKFGNKVNTLSKEENERWGKAARPILDEYVNNMKAKGLPGNEALKFCLDYLKKF